MEIKDEMMALQGVIEIMSRDELDDGAKRRIMSYVTARCIKPLPQNPMMQTQQNQEFAGRY